MSTRRERSEAGEGFQDPFQIWQVPVADARAIGYTIQEKIAFC